MSRRVQCPKCRAVLQEPPPGNPYYKCGNCFTVLQAKHATPGAGPQRPMGEELSTTPPASRQFGHSQSQSTNDSHGSHTRNSNEEAPLDESSFRRQRTLPTRLTSERGGGGGGGGSDSAPPPPAKSKEAPSPSSSSASPSPASAAPKSAMKSSSLSFLNFRRQRTLPTKLQKEEVAKAEEEEEEAEEEVDRRRWQQQQQADPLSRGTSSVSSRNRNNLTSQPGKPSGGSLGQVSGRTAGGRGGHLPNNSTQPAPRGGRGVVDYESSLSADSSFMFRRQRTLPSQMPQQQQQSRGWEDEEADEEDGEEEEEEVVVDARGRRGAARQGPQVASGRGGSIGRKRDSGWSAGGGGGGGGERNNGNVPLPSASPPPTVPSPSSASASSSMFSRQRTLPSRLPSGGSTSPSSAPPPSSVSSVQIPSKLKALLDRDRDSPPPASSYQRQVSSSSSQGRQGGLRKDGPGLSGSVGREGGSGSREGLQLPPRLQALLEKKGSGSATVGAVPRERGGRGSSSGGEGGPEARQALREALLTGGRGGDPPASSSLAAADASSGPAVMQRSQTEVPYSQHRRRMSDPMGASDPRSSSLQAPPATARAQQGLNPRVQGPGASPSPPPSSDPHYRRMASASARTAGGGGGYEGAGQGRREAEEEEVEEEEETFSRQSEDTTVVYSDLDEWGEEDGEEGRGAGYRGVRGVPLLVSQQRRNGRNGVGTGRQTGGGGGGGGPQQGQQGQQLEQRKHNGVVGTAAGASPPGLPRLPSPEHPQVVQCQHCTQMLAVPPNLPAGKRGVQKLRCGKCLQVSAFASASSAAPSPSPYSQFQEEGERGGGGGGGRVGRAGRGSEDLYRRGVRINGCALADRLVERAEDRAGPIHPGDYWYDSSAGFWGAMGGPCLGIIPPGIQELNSVMPVDCAGGSTGVFVNGRELHRRDLQLLQRRGLPDTPGKHYRLDVWGRVLDEQTGAEGRGLGKLAPSLDGRRRGGGMFIP